MATDACRESRMVLGSCHLLRSAGFRRFFAPPSSIGRSHDGMCGGKEQRNRRRREWRLVEIVRMKSEGASDDGSDVVDILLTHGSGHHVSLPPPSSWFGSPISPSCARELGTGPCIPADGGSSSRMRSLYSLLVEGARPYVTGRVRIGCTGAVRPTSPPNVFPRLSNEGLTTCQYGAK